MINDFFNWCVLVLEMMAEYSGMSYELINILIFVILQPLLIMVFFYLWRRETKKYREISDYYDFHK
mgnify:FL=1|tara:strand:- start:843 stop:1040 length:198 start_codon:yes stop_codon:yes gene_type:complete